ncbi:hypothetical protein UlMin_030018 [Ulmus minor]
MTDKSKKEKALIVTRGLGLEDEEVKPVLRELLKAYEYNWEHIEFHNYQILVDAFFDRKENQKAEDKKRGGRDGSGRPFKKPHAAESVEWVEVSRGDSSSGGRERPSSMNYSRASPAVCLKKPTGEPRSSHIQRNEASKPHRIHGRPFKKPHAAESVEWVEVSRGDSSSGGRERPSSTTYSRASPAVCLKKPTGEPRSSHIQRNEDSKPHRKELAKPSPQRANGSHVHVQKRSICLDDITKGAENLQISLIDESGKESLPMFNYIPQNLIYQNAYINISLARIADDDCCSDCKGDCLSSRIPCACARQTGGEFAYTPQGLLKDEFLRACVSMKENPRKYHFFYCQHCPLERSRDDQCKGHLLRKFIKECWRKCGCKMKCGNRVVQQGISCKLQVFSTPEGKGWGLRTLEALPKGTFVCEYIGEILTNTELYNRNMGNGKERHAYPVLLDADWNSEEFLRDEEALCLDATFHGNVARFINHRCSDSNLIDIPVEVETPDHHYYHLAFFTIRKVAAFEELTWDYGIDFDDIDHPIKAFTCSCGSANCRDRKKKRVFKQII